ncbi:unnamed protein product [Urochloa decumbens]|uniref:HAT C-terminal dimerisation domain-containing protein n=1 Tax=Urochloa decumbens TaxID=240449 RepID=A0ABC9BUW8_9POAL
MIALNGYDPSVVEDGYFRSFVRRLSPEFKLPSRLAVEDVCDAIFDETRNDLFSRLRHTSGRVSLAVGRAEAVEGAGLVACHFIDDDWNLHRMVMDAYDNVPWPLYHGPLSGVPEVSGVPDVSPEVAHDLSTLAIDRVMHDGTASGSGRDVLDRVFMVARRKWENCNHTEPKDHIEQEYPTTHPSRREMIVCDTYMDTVLLLIGRRLVAHPDLVIDTIAAHHIESGVQDLHLTSKRRQHLLSCLGLVDLRAYNDHWYSCYCSLQVLRNEGSCTIPGIDSELVQMLCNVWGALYCAIERVSAPSTPTSNLCLGELFNVREVLQFEKARAAGGDSARVLQDAIDTLDRRMHESYLIWSIPLVLDPRYKLTYIEFIFKRAFSSKAAAYYISEVTIKIRKLYTEYTEHDGATDGADSDGATATAVGSAGLLEQAWDEHCRAHGEGGMLPPVASSYPEAEKELDRYLKDRLAPQTEGFDILNWWKAHSSEYPTVARMARDALAMPTCSQLSSEQVAHVRSILRGYSKEEYKHQVGLT